MIDVTHQISAVTRQVGRRALPAGEARVVTISQTYDTTVDDLWDACTNAERLPRWFLPVSGELRLNGRYQFEGNAGGTIERCDPPKGLAATWEYGGEVSWVELRLSPEPDGRSRFQLEHTAHVDDEKWAEFGPGAVGVGWDMAVNGLAVHLATGESAEAEAGMAWAMSEEGKRFITLSSESWRDANIAGGEDPTVARECADRTTAAYTGT